MDAIDDTIAKVVNAPTWNQRVAQIRQIPGRHGTDEHVRIFASVARESYVPHLTPDFAFFYEREFYSEDHFRVTYERAYSATAGFADVRVAVLAELLQQDPPVLLVFRTITGFTKEEFAHCTKLIGELSDLPGLSGSKVDSMEKQQSRTNKNQALVAAITLTRIIDRTIFDRPPEGFKSKQDKPDTKGGWQSAGELAAEGVPFWMLLHQRHYGGAFRQATDSGSRNKGDTIEDEVEELLRENEILYIRTGSHNQADIVRRFEVHVTPAPDFVIYDQDDNLRAMFECKIASDGGTARDKAPRFDNLRDECLRLGGVPLFAILGGIGWARVNDALGPVVRDTDGRVFTLTTLPELLSVAPFPSLT